MSTIPNGLQTHVLWNMDGRTWIEPRVRSTDSPVFLKAVEKGWARIIPQDRLQEFVASL